MAPDVVIASATLDIPGAFVEVARRVRDGALRGRAAAPRHARGRRRLRLEPRARGRDAARPCGRSCATLEARIRRRRARRAAGRLLSGRLRAASRRRVASPASPSASAPAAALDGVDLEVAPGEVHALLGENGAGKTTLVNVLIGLVRPDARHARARRPSPWTSRASGPRGARAPGIGMVHQHSTLVPALPVAENLAFGDAARRAAGSAPARRAPRAEALPRALRPRRPARRAASTSSPSGQRQRAEILRALGRGARLLVLDEPTAVLTPGEVGALFPVLRRLRGEGCARRSSSRTSSRRSARSPIA